jgi:hypothetical protein
MRVETVRLCAAQAMPSQQPRPWSLHTQPAPLSVSLAQPPSQVQASRQSACALPLPCALPSPMPQASVTGAPNVSDGSAISSPPSPGAPLLFTRPGLRAIFTSEPMELLASNSSWSSEFEGEYLPVLVNDAQTVLSWQARIVLTTVSLSYLQSPCSVQQSLLVLHHVGHSHPSGMPLVNEHGC